MRIVIPSVNYGDFLAVTLPAWRKIFPTADITVVTHPDDLESAAAACMIPNVSVLRTKVWYDDGAAFNKAKALDHAFGFDGGWIKPPAAGETCATIDADCYPFGKFDESLIAPLVIYGCLRRECLDPMLLDRVVRGEMPHTELPLLKSYGRGKYLDPVGMIGFFQCWRARPKEGFTQFGEFHTAARYDVVFGHSFLTHRNLPALQVAHLGEHKKNWIGRVTPRWVQPVATNS